MSSATAEATVVAPLRQPPIPPREEERVIHVGAAPPGWKAALPRQSEASQEVLMDPPVALPDPYGWLRDESRTTPAVLEHLKAENAYTQALTSHLDGVRATLYDEMLAAIQETDYRTPRPDGDFLYYTRTMEGKSYTIHCRAPKAVDEGGDLQITWDQTADSPILPGEEVILDVNHLAEGKSYCSTGSVRHSPSHKYLAYSADFSGGETFRAFVKELGTDQVVFSDDTLAISGSVRWGADDNTLFYLKMDEAHRPYQVYRRKLASDEPDEVMLLEEPDELYWMGIYKSLDGKYLFIESSSKETSEIHYLDLQDPTATLQCIAPRRLKVLYEAEHREGQWWIQSNLGGLPNMALWTAPAVPDCADQWTLVRTAEDGEVLFDGSLERSLDGITCFKNHVVASGREGGLPRIWFLSLSSAASEEDEVVTTFERLTFEEEAYDVAMGANYEYDTGSVVVGYDSLVTPTQSLEISLKDPKERKVLKERAVPGYDRSLYSCERTTVLSRSGTTEIPISLVYRQDVMEEHKRTGEALCVHLYGTFLLTVKVICVHE
jgi:oligopeptidase B